MYFADYHKAVTTAVEVLEDCNISQAPVNLKLIFDALKNEIVLRTYRDFMISSNKTLEETKKFFDTDLGVCCYELKSGRYIIYYNSDHSEGLIRFTIAHELGHIFLEHHTMVGTDIFNRSFLPRNEYEEYEKEANAFARNLLSPAPLAWDLIQECKNGQNSHVQQAFKITSTAANVRINFVRRDMRDYDNIMSSAIRKIKLKYQRYCTYCKTLVPKKANFCPTCGSNRFGHSLRYNPLPFIIKADSKGFLHQCPQCRNNNISGSANFCIICGLPLRNLCFANNPNIKSRKRHFNPSNAKFCQECGSETTYNRYNLKMKYEEEIPMKYLDGVPYDEDTLRVKICPVCSNEEFSDNATHCRICGTNLYNQCEGTEVYTGYGETNYVDQHSNPSNARFCEICGKPTYFKNAGILVEYKDYKEPKPEKHALASMINYMQTGDSSFLPDPQANNSTDDAPKSSVVPEPAFDDLTFDISPDIANELPFK